MYKCIVLIKSKPPFSWYISMTSHSSHSLFLTSVAAALRLEPGFRPDEGQEEAVAVIEAAEGALLCCLHQESPPCELVEEESPMDEVEDIPQVDNCNWEVDSAEGVVEGNTDLYP
jgi:hypothetical protein